MYQKLAYTILVELLAYQFASPVHWTETQDLLFTNYKFEHLIELGPGPTLTGMATRTLKAKYEASDDSISLTRVIYCHAKNPKEIYYQFEGEVAEPETAPESATTSEPAAVAAPAPSAGPAADVADEPLKAVDTLRVIIAQKLKKKVEEVPFQSRSRTSSGANRRYRTRSSAILTSSSPLLLRTWFLPWLWLLRGRSEDLVGQHHCGIRSLCGNFPV